jgi:hypothetical protein
MAYIFGAGDETGQFGFKFDRGATAYFVFTVILTNEPHLVREGVTQLRRELRLAETTEFKFHSTPHAFRLRFYQHARWWPLVARSLFIDKRELPMKFKQMPSWEFYGFCVAQLLSRLPAEELDNTTLVLDEFGPPAVTLRAVREQLRQQGLWGHRQRAFKKIAFQRSHSEAIIQVADMFGGAVYRWVLENDDAYYRAVQEQMLVWEYRAGK